MINIEGVVETVLMLIEIKISRRVCWKRIGVTAADCVIGVVAGVNV